VNPDQAKRSFRKNIALSVWIALVVLELLILVFGIPESFTILLQPCSETVTECQSRMQLMPAEAALWSMETYAWYTISTRVLARLVSFGLGVLIFVKKPNSRIAWITSLYLIIGIETGIADSLAFAQPAWLPITLFTQFVGVICLFLFFLLFPNDRFEPRWTRILFWVFTLFSALNYVIAQVLARGDLDAQTTSQVETLRMVLGIPFLGGFLILVGVIIYRYRAVFTSTERQKTKWVIFAFALGYGVFAGYILLSISLGWEDALKPPWLYVLEDILVVGIIDYLVPVAIAIAILRYQLFDIDLIIRKTLQYTLLTGLLVLVYFGSVILLQGLTENILGEQSPLVIVFSTLAIAALFNPLRIRLQDFIDRRFYRKKYDAEQALVHFSTVTRDEVDIRKITHSLLNAVEDTMQPERVSLWLVSAAKRVARSTSKGKEQNYGKPSNQ
jgi:hypothetical protein